ncbi:MAG: metallophosphoesterase family protein [Planctomycetes bacterium]|nr:metallophosphoesterase family protein [Planctomycetota bacterium]MBT6452677.1 metallophosphoesterase family protein [Planctomycetota bacterium]MBT6542353.1 metallophosphoesterase family protein [Planctomycetota bacterium]MBT6784288.1 metallophosphoesterase family protein [Planctomycetota bacterium]MBT6968874.1 metallophosphoesterase family protein [Planctomycetota bacterium]
MRIAVISDIHGNLEALTSVFELLDQQGVDRTLCLGDVVGYGPDPGACLSKIQDRCDVIVAGNHEHAVLDLLDLDYFNPIARQATLWTRSQLDEEQLEYIRSWPLVHHEPEFSIVHGSLDQPDLFDYIQTTWDAHLSFQQLKTPVCFIGHSHVPVSFLLSDVIRYNTDAVVELQEGLQAIVNVGSVGQPRDGNPAASLVIYEPEERRIERFRVEYDIEAVQQKIRQSGLPEFLAERLAEGR